MHNWQQVLRVLNEHGRSQQAWDYVTALRGPDFGSIGDKELTTCIIRGTLYEHVGALDIRYTVDVAKRVMNDQGDFKEFCSRSPHFLQHFRKGLRALGVYYALIGHSEIQEMCESIAILLVYSMDEHDVTEAAKTVVSLVDAMEKVDYGGN